VRPARSEPDWRSYDWDDVAADYAGTMAPLTTEPYAELLDLVGGVTAGTLVLDVGTGTGAELENVPSRAVGIDISLKMLAEGRRRHTTATLAAADVIDLPFRSGTFDVVSANFFLPYVTKLDTALHDMLRVLARGGALAVSVWTDVRDDLTRLWEDLATERLGPELVRDALKQGSPWGAMTADAARLERVLRDAGLRPVEVVSRRYRSEMSRANYVTTKEIGVIGRYLHKMLGPERWPAFREHARAAYAERFGETVVDHRDVLLAVGRKP
jgi:SAM-dependent methyltransferase